MPDLPGVENFPRHSLSQKSGPTEIRPHESDFYVAIRTVRVRVCGQQFREQIEAGRIAHCLGPPTVTDRRYKAAQGRIVAALYERRAHELRDARTSGGYRSLQRIMVFP